MRYLKKFGMIKESVDTNDLQDFCDRNLATLLDNGYSVVVSSTEHTRVTINIFKDNMQSFVLDHLPLGIEMSHYRPDQEFSMEDIRDYLIPFMSVLKDEYDIGYRDKDVTFIYNKRSDIGDGFKVVSEIGLEKINLERIIGLFIKVNSKI